MSGQIIPQEDRQLDPTSIEAWRQHRTRVIQLEGGTAVRVKTWDVLALLAEDGAPNPLLAAIVGQVEGQPNANPEGDAEARGRAVMRDPTALAHLRTMLNGLLIKVVVAPPLVEQGHAEGVSVDEFGLDEKLFIFTEMLGGDARLNAVLKFRDAAPEGLDSALRQ